MSEKRFTIHKESKYKEEWHAYPFCIKEDGEVVFNTIPLSIAEKVRDKLNTQQATIQSLQDQLQDYKEIKDNWDSMVAKATEVSLRNVELVEENARLRIENKKLKEEEKLYAQEILRLNELLKQYQSFKDLGGDY